MDDPSGTLIAYQMHAPYPISARTGNVTWHVRWDSFRRAWLTPFDFNRASSPDELKAELMRLAYCLAYVFPVHKEATGENVWLDARRNWGVRGSYSYFGRGFDDVRIGCVGGLGSENEISLHVLARMNLPVWQRTRYDDLPAVVAQNAQRIMSETIRRARKAVRAGRALNKFLGWLFVHVTARRIVEDRDGSLV